MATYSHSRVSTFEQCPRKYKFQYIDKETPEIDNTIEAFMGDIVHQSLENLYKNKKFKGESKEVFKLMYSLKDNPHKGKLLTQIGGNFN